VLKGGVCGRFSSDFCFLKDIGDFGGGGRVRTRNTLHIVVARKSSIFYDAVERRKKKKRKDEKR